MYYVIGNKQMKCHLMSGPYKTEGHAQDDIERVFNEAQNYYDAKDMEYYSVEFLPKFNKLALLNLRGFCAAG
jgi:hypothetical protein